MYLLPFNCKATPLEVKNGCNETTVANVPAYRDEPYAPSDPNLNPWALLYYRQGNRDPQKYWNDEAKKIYNDFKGLLKADAEQKAAVTQTIAAAKNDEEKIVALTSYVRKRVRNLTDADVTEAERADFLKKLPKDRERTSSEIFKSGIGFPFELNVLFGALVTQAGFDVRPVLVANRSEVVVDVKTLPERYLVDDTVMGVKTGDSLRIVNVSSKYLYPGMLTPGEEGMTAIVADPKAAAFMVTPVAAPEASVEQRTANLMLSSDGSLTGNVEEAYTGHKAEYYRSQLARKSPSQREEWFHDRVVRMFPSATMTGLKLENIEDASKPFQVGYQLDAPLVAQVTGKRILFHPNAFRRSQGGPFSASERRLPIQFPYAWKEIDEVHIEFPYGFELENADSPGSFDFGDPGAYQLTMTVKTGAGTELIVSREFTFGAKGILAFQVAAYPSLKKVFDEVQLRDSHTLSLRGN